MDNIFIEEKMEVQVSKPFGEGGLVSPALSSAAQEREEETKILGGRTGPGKVWSDPSLRRR
jgi:hypothetical protein